MKFRTVILPALALFLCFPALAATETASPAPAAGAVDTTPARLPELSWRFGGSHSLRLAGYIVTDMMAFPRHESGFDTSWHTTFNLRAARISLRYAWADTVRLRLDVEASTSAVEMQEAWFEYAPFEELALRIGRQRVPFGLAQNISLPERKLMEAPMIAGNPKDFIDIGVVLHGSAWGDRLRYALGTVTGSRDIAVNVNETPDLAARLCIALFAGMHPAVSRLVIGGSATWGPGPQRNGFRGRSTGGFTFADPPAIRGEQLRYGAELSWISRWAGLSAEYQVIRQQRDGLTDFQNAGQVGDLQEYTVWGWYVEATGHLWGQRSDTGPLTGIEIAARGEYIDYGDGAKSLGGADYAPLTDSHVWAVTAGINGYLPWSIRLSAVWQGMWFGDMAATPTWDPGEKADVSMPVHHVFLRAQIEL